MSERLNDKLDNSVIIGCDIRTLFELVYISFSISFRVACETVVINLHRFTGHSSQSFFNIHRFIPGLIFMEIHPRLLMFMIVAIFWTKKKFIVVAYNWYGAFYADVSRYFPDSPDFSDYIFMCYLCVIIRIWPQSSFKQKSYNNGRWNYEIISHK